MFVGETGVARIIERTCEILKASRGVAEDVRSKGGIDLATIQKHLNFWFSLSLDLHGSEVSSNAASYFANGLKGRAREETYKDHKALDAYYPMNVLENDRVVSQEVPLRNAMNEVLRDWYVGDCASGLGRWNAIFERHGLSDRLKLPDRKFNRAIGMYSAFHFSPEGRRLSNEDWERLKDDWLPCEDDTKFLRSIMAEPIFEPGIFANYIAPPRRGVNRMPINFRYVRTEE